jgi:hypothetical protein
MGIEQSSVTSVIPRQPQTDDKTFGRFDIQPSATVFGIVRYAKNLAQQPANSSVSSKGV